MTDEVVQEILNAIKDSLMELKNAQKDIQLDINEIKIEQAEQHVTLQEHTRRSTANEEEIKLVKEILQKQIDPLKVDSNRFKGALALLGVISTVVFILSLLHKI